MSPQTTPERQRRWPGMDTQAIKYLEDRGFRLTRDWCWREPRKHRWTARDEDAVIYLIEEWDYGPAVPHTYAQENMRATSP